MIEVEFDSRLEISLCLLRYSVFLVMFMWTLDKFFNPDHAAGVFSKFYGLQGLGKETLYGLAGLELLIIVGFVLGLYRTLTYGTVLVLHGISTFSSYAQYMDPFNHLLFFAAWPMLAACVVLYLLRDRDTYLTLAQ